MKTALLSLLVLLLASCGSMYKSSVASNSNDVIFSETFDHKNLEDYKDSFFVLSGNYVLDALGGRNALTSRFNNNRENALLFGPEKLSNYSLETSFFYKSTANNTVAAGLGGGGIAGFKIHLYPTGDQMGKLRLIYNGVIYDEVEMKMLPDTWYKIRLDLKTVGTTSTLQCVAYEEGKHPKSWMISGDFQNLDLKGQVSVLTYPVRSIPVYIDDIIIRKND
ncbi:hypothetical protein PQO01_15075 [Lentisphaera marina]|uniref:hypothetical protein n=1 Tax=Lentisphaera marina TaxID=1111041 RepID=UPI00236628CA|nr:hypothetical protein [Lentisphaera marina]MDD7986271.1 hypothetical protein [Lentisphaera marina]